MDAPLAVSVALNLATTLLLAYTGVLVLGRPASPDARLARRMFATWWFCAAAVIFLAGAHTLLAFAGVSSLALSLVLVYAGALPLAVGVCALLYYLVYVYTGRRSALWPLAAAYALFLLFELYYFGSFGERHLETTAWSVQLVGDAEPASWVSITFAVLLAVPILGTVLAYGLLYFRSPDAEHRYRVSLVSMALLLWFGAVLFGFVLGWDREDWFPLVYEAPGVVAAAMIVTAYRPPAWLRRQWTADPPKDAA